MPGPQTIVICALEPDPVVLSRAGTASLNWAADTPIKNWDGISVGGTPLRITDISLAARGLTGTMPPEMATSPTCRYWISPQTS